MRFKARLLLLLIALLAATPHPAAAESALRAFNAAVGSAMRHYRYAGYYLHTGNVALGAIELEAMQGKWKALTARFTATVPDAFGDDPKFADALRSVESTVAGALKALDAGDRGSAARSIAPIRAAIAALRRRNQIRVYADCIGDMNRAFDAAWKYRHAPPDFADPKQSDAVRAAIAVTDYWYRRCQRRAPRDTAKQPDFGRLMEGSMASIRRLWRAVQIRDRLLLINTLRELRSFDRLIYLKFG